MNRNKRCRNPFTILWIQVMFSVSLLFSPLWPFNRAQNLHSEIRSHSNFNFKRPYLGNETRFFRSAGPKILVWLRAFTYSFMKVASATLSPSFGLFQSEKPLYSAPNTLASPTEPPSWLQIIFFILVLLWNVLCHLYTSTQTSFNLSVLQAGHLSIRHLPQQPLLLFRDTN